MVEKIPVGKVTHFFGNIAVGVIELTGKLSVGDKILIEGATTSFEQPIKRMEIDREEIKHAGKGDAIGVKFIDRARPGDLVYVLK